MTGWTARLARAIRDVPLGILLFATLLAIAAIGSLAVGVYLLLDDGTLSLWAGLLALLIGPAALYMAHGLIFKARWAWSASLTVFILLLASSLFRLVAGGEGSGGAAFEIPLELAAIYYLWRPRVRRGFLPELPALPDEALRHPCGPG